MNECMKHMVAKQYGITKFPEKTVVAMAYVPYQISEDLEIYSAERGMCAGTMFPDLNKPFEPCRACGGDKNE